MPITIGSNINSLVAQRRLAESSVQLTATFERLASGQRINRASDDAAGLAISDSLKSQARVYTQGIKNLNDGLSLLNIADSVIEQLSGITTRLTELAAQAAKGSYSHVQRKALDAEAQALSDEYFRIKQSATFNRLSL
jgi:flagellin